MDNQITESDKILLNNLNPREQYFPFYFLIVINIIFVILFYIISKTSDTLMLEYTPKKILLAFFLFFINTTLYIILVRENKLREVKETIRNVVFNINLKGRSRNIVSKLDDTIKSSLININDEYKASHSLKDAYYAYYLLDKPNNLIAYETIKVSTSLFCGSSLSYFLLLIFSNTIPDLSILVALSDLLLYMAGAGFFIFWLEIMYWLWWAIIRLITLPFYLLEISADKLNQEDFSTLSD